MKILIFGRGVIGTQYGWALEQAGNAVDFYVRPGRAAEYGSVIELDIYDQRTSMRGVRVHERWSVTYIEDIPAGHDYDLILLSVPHHRFAEAAAYLGPRVANASILVFNNFWEEPLEAAAALPRPQLVWGFPGAGGGFTGNVLRGSFFKSVQFGTFNAQLSARERAVRSLFKDAGFAISEQPDLRGWLWTHFALNAGLHAQALQTGSIARMMDSTAQGRQAVLNVREALAVLEARGVNLKHFRKDAALFGLPPWVGASALKAGYRLHRPTRAIVDAVGSFDEMRAFCRDMLAEAKRRNVSTPRLDAARPYFEQIPARASH